MTQRAKREFVESLPEVLGGEPVLIGTRISVRHVANLVKQGATSDELQDDLDLTPAQIEAARAWAAEEGVEDMKVLGREAASPAARKMHPRETRK